VLTYVQVAQSELQRCITDPWPEHEKAIDELIRCQLAKHRYLRRLPPGCDSSAAATEIGSRTRVVLQQISLQLTSKASIGKFEMTKTALKQTVPKVERCADDADWVIV
jgi:hypothetical protein